MPCRDDGPHYITEPCRKPHLKDDEETLLRHLASLRIDYFRRKKWAAEKASEKAANEKRIDKHMEALYNAVVKAQPSGRANVSFIFREKGKEETLEMGMVTTDSQSSDPKEGSLLSKFELWLRKCRDIPKEMTFEVHKFGNEKLVIDSFHSH